ncbi:MAG: [FeFe] hydrogenase, group A [Deltaproteobacteria bacterium]|jgi:NADH-quinone oxidoreductase subunit G|nr:[FeFe] hydrogenase, group A [Deltaproteobacteria bacterium]
MSKGVMTIDGQTVEIENERNVLELIRKAGIVLPTFCYHSELSIHGGCRMCIVEDDRGSLIPSCSEEPRNGMIIHTNTRRVRRYRRNILELLLANHSRDCTICFNSGNCRLQELARSFNISSIRFMNTAHSPHMDHSSKCISKDPNRCILCGDCVRICNEVQNVGAIDFAHRGSDMHISTPFGVPLAESVCVGCGQCAAVCPTGAIIVKNDINKVWRALDNQETFVTVQVAPAVRVALGQEFGLGDGENSIGYIVAALHRLGFDKVFDTSTSADLTVIEESREFVQRLQSWHDMPLFTSCCPAWINYVEKHYPEIMPHVSTCRSPMQMFASVLADEYRKVPGKRHVHVAIMPCTAKKFEAARDEFVTDGQPNVDFVLTTQELVQMIRQSGILWEDLEPEGVDNPFSVYTGAAVIFGVTGGVTEAVLRELADDHGPTALKKLAFVGVRGQDGLKETKITVGGKELSIAVVSGLGNASALIEDLKSGVRKYHFVEVMACPGGCVCGAGQPVVPLSHRAARGKGLYSADLLTSIKRSEDNPLMATLYDGLLKGRNHDLLHVHYPGHKGHHNHAA